MDLHVLIVLTVVGLVMSLGALLSILSAITSLKKDTRRISVLADTYLERIDTSLTRHQQTLDVLSQSLSALVKAYVDTNTSTRELASQTRLAMELASMELNKPLTPGTEPRKM